MSNRKYTQEHIDFLTENIPGRPFKDLTAMFNEKFGMSVKVTAIVSVTNKHGLHNGIDSRLNKGHEPTQFKKGLIPWNKGKKGLNFGGKETQFKKGHKAHNWVPLGSERVNRDGYVDIKVDDGKLQKNWKGKHIVIWEAANGPVPHGHIVMFGDGDKRNFNPENLILVSRKQLVRLNQCNLIQNDVKLTKAGIIIADIHNRIDDRKRVEKKARQAKRRGNDRG